jgi:hypothetical protein
MELALLRMRIFLLTANKSLLGFFGGCCAFEANRLCNVNADGSGSLKGAKSNDKKHRARRNGNRGLLRGRHIR